MNKYNLPRHIDEATKLKVRQNSKFGCVVPNCRNAFYTYEHLIPEYKDAKVHDPEKICLACPTHNPRKEGPDGQANYSKQQLIEFYDELKSSKIGPEIKNMDFFYGLKSPVEIKIGESIFNNIYSLINIDGINVFSFRQNRNPEPFEPKIVFSGTFKKLNGDLLFRIEENEWISDTSHWDIQTANGRITIFDKEKNVIFKAQKIPELNRIEILQLELWYPLFHIKIENEQLLVGRVSNRDSKFIYMNINAIFEGSKCAIYLNKEDLNPDLNFYGFEISGNRGATLFGNGIFLGKGGGTMRISSANIIASKNVENKTPKPKVKTPIPSNGNYFVQGIVKEKIIEFPLWTEIEYWLNGQKLDAQPNSWGIINEKGEYLYYLSSDESEDLALNSGFVGHFADDLTGTEIQDKVFEMEIEEMDSERNLIRKRIKRSEYKGQKIISEHNPQTKKYYYPQQFAGVSPWKQ
jgi:hypothetical protein